MCYTCTVERFGEYILEQYVSVRAELIVGEAGAFVGRRSNYSAKLRPRFAYQWPNSVKMYTYQFEKNTMRFKSYEHFH